jgi:hypothetical protein
MGKYNRKCGTIWIHSIKRAKFIFFSQLFLTIIFPQENKFKKMLIPINNINMQKFTRDLQYQNSQNLLKKI